MKTSKLELYLDEFSSRYWESCQEVMSTNRFLDPSLPRLSSPLPENIQSDMHLESCRKSDFGDTSPVARDRNYVPYSPSLIGPIQETLPQNLLNMGSCQGFAVLPPKKPLKNKEQPYSQLVAAKSQTKGTHPTNVGNPYYKKSGG